MKKCSKTLSGKHVWKEGYWGLDLDPNKVILKERESGGWYYAPVCKACGMIDDREKEEK